MPNYNEVITSHWSQWPSSKRSTKNNTAEDVQKRESSYSLSGNVNSEATMENSMEVPWKTKHRGIIWSCNPFPGLDLEKFIIWNDTCTPIFRVALFTSQDMELIKMSSDRKMKTTWYIYKLEYHSVKKQKK